MQVQAVFSRTQPIADRLPAETATEELDRGLPPPLQVKRGDIRADSGFLNGKDANFEFGHLFSQLNQIQPLFSWNYLFRQENSYEGLVCCPPVAAALAVTILR